MKMLKEHGIAAIIYGGTFIDEDFRNRKVADQWFQDKYAKKLAAKDFETTTKYRFDPKFGTGGTFGVNYASVEGDNSTELKRWIDLFKKDKHEAALSFWYEIHKGIHESLREF